MGFAIGNFNLEIRHTEIPITAALPRRLTLRDKIGPKILKSKIFRIMVSNYFWVHRLLKHSMNQTRKLYFSFVWV